MARRQNVWRTYGKRTYVPGAAPGAARAGTSAALTLAAAAIVALAGAAGAADRTFKVPEGCTAYATVQLRGCQVAHHYRCTGDAPGDQWAAYLDGEGPHFVSRIDAETRWLESYDLIDGERDQLKDETDPASFTVLLQSGRDDFDFTTQSSTGEVRRYRGYDQLTGETVTIDGVPLERTTFSLSAETASGEMIWRRSGKQFIHREWRLFYSDAETFENAAGDVVETADTPVEFSFPGDKGFLSAEPKFDCDVVTAGLGGAP